MGARWKHFRTVCRHRKVVRRECAACGIWWQGVMHDLSKFSPAEFGPSALYFQGTGARLRRRRKRWGIPTHGCITRGGTGTTGNTGAITTTTPARSFRTRFLTSLWWR